MGARFAQQDPATEGEHDEGQSLHHRCRKERRGGSERHGDPGLNGEGGPHAQPDEQGSEAGREDDGGQKGLVGEFDHEDRGEGQRDDGRSHADNLAGSDGREAQ